MPTPRHTSVSTHTIEIDFTPTAHRWIEAKQLALHSEVFVLSPHHAVTNVRGQYN